MYYLEFIYALVVSTQKLLERPEPRYYPFLMMTMLLAGAVDAVSRIALRLGPPELVPILSESEVYRRGDWTWWFSFAITAILVWWLFDRRRDAIAARFSGLRPCTSHVHRIAISFSCIGLGLAFAYLGTLNPVLTILVFLAALIGGGALLRGRRDGPGYWRSP